MFHNSRMVKVFWILRVGKVVICIMSLYPQVLYYYCQVQNVRVVKYNYGTSRKNEEVWV